MRAKALAGGLLFLCALAAGCGDDGDGESDGGAGDGAGTGGTSGTGGTGGRQTLPDPDGGSGTGGDGAVGPDEGEEGYPCLTDADCGLAENGQQLSCLESGFQDFGVCARSCTQASCESDEVCLTLGGVDPRCTNLINEEFALCGIVETSDCAAEAGLVCLYLPQRPYGVCTTLCESGGDEDGGAPNPACDDDQFCRGAVVMSSEQDPRDGVCGVHAARGEECGIFLGAFCDSTDICGPESVPVGDDTRFVCLEDCAVSPDLCDEGKTCTPYMGSFLCM